MAHMGSCLCGQAHYTIAADPVGARMCWCQVCQKIASGSATVNVVFPLESVQFSGEIAKTERVADSGNRVERGFCPRCGSHLYSKTLEPAGDQIRIRAGTLDDPEIGAPQMVIWTASAPSWAHFDPNLPQYPGAPPSKPLSP
jgi:hypothetical protein